MGDGAASWPSGPGGERFDRTAGRDPEDRRANPGTARRPDPRRCDEAGQPARSRHRKGRLGKPVEFGHKAQLVDNDDGIVLDHDVQPGNPADGPRLKPAVERVIGRTGRKPQTVTADRGYGEAGVDDDLHDLGVRNVVIPRKGRPSEARQAEERHRAFRWHMKWRTGCEGRISTLKRGYGWDRTMIDTIEGARIWTGHGVLAHNLIKISALAG
jgi:transposase, IS5 family